MSSRRLFWGIFQLIIVSIHLTQTGCKLNSDGTEPDVYVAGSTISSAWIETPCFWKNGMRSELSCLSEKGGAAVSIFVAGDNVYIAGYTNSGSNGARIPCFWKDGIRFDLPMDGALDGWAASICVADGDVYISGHTYKKVGSLTLFIPCFWKNGIYSDLQVPVGYLGGLASSIYIMGGDVYICGNVYKDDSELYKSFAIPCYWKNGVYTDLSTSNPQSDYYTQSIAVSGGDIYVAGFYAYETIHNYQTFPSVPCLWKNGAETHLSMEDILDWNGWASSVCISGKDIFIAGGVSELNSYASVPCFWKNGDRTSLRVIDDDHGADAKSIYVFENDVYISGYSQNDSGIVVPCYWENKSRTDLSLPGSARKGYALSIFVL